MANADVLAGLVAYLKADTDVSTLSTNRVFGQKLPNSESSSMPRAALIIAQSGGFGLMSNGDFYYQRVDVRAYGATVQEANTLHLAAMRAMQALTNTRINGAVLYSAQLESGANYSEEQTTNWPFYFSTWGIATNLLGA